MVDSWVFVRGSKTSFSPHNGHSLTSDVLILAVCTCRVFFSCYNNLTDFVFSFSPPVKGTDLCDVLLKVPFYNILDYILSLNRSYIDWLDFISSLWEVLLYKMCVAGHEFLSNYEKETN
jgi:hypothetical protein